MQLHVKRVFRDAVPGLAQVEIDELEKVLLRDGVTEPIQCLPSGAIVDGMHRFQIIKRHGLKFAPKIRHDLKGLSESEVVLWIKERAVAQRNLSVRDRKLLLGEIYNARKQGHGGSRKGKSDVAPKIMQRKNSNSQAVTGQGDISSPQNEDLKSKTSQEVAEEFGTSKATVERGAKLAEAMAKLSPGLQKQIKDNPKLASDAAILKLAEMQSGDWQSIAREVRVGNHKTFDAALGIKNGRPKGQAPKRGKVTVKVSAAKMVDMLSKNHLGHLVRGLDKVAETNGGKGKWYKQADDALEKLTVAMKKMREGEQ